MSKLLIPWSHDSRILKTSVRLAFSLCLLIVGALVTAMLGSGSFTAEATDAPKMSLDMDISGNTYSDPGLLGDNSMDVRQVDSCTSHIPGNPAPHPHIVDLVIQDVEDLTAFQARLNYNEAQVRLAAVNFVPFADTSVEHPAAISFLNLPLDETGQHKTLLTIPPTPQTGTAIFGAVPLGQISNYAAPDTPPKNPPDNPTYSAPRGGLLARLTFQVQAQQVGQLIEIDLDDAVPNAPGSAINHGGSGSLALFDGTIAEGLPCPGVPTPPPLPIPTAPPLGPDTDGDGFSDTLEAHAGTNPVVACGTVSWPPDFDDSARVDDTDLALIKRYFGKMVPLAPARYDIAPEPVGDNFVDIFDISKVAGYYGSQCTPTLTIPDSDHDGFSDSLEIHVGTDPLHACPTTASPDDEPIDAWPPDVNDDTFADIFDISRVSAYSGQSVPPAPMRYDVAPEPAGDNVIDEADISRINAFFGQRCPGP